MSAIATSLLNKIKTRRARTFEFRVADCKGFVTVGEYEDGRPGEIFISVSKQGSTLAGIMDAFAISISHGLQYGVPLRAFVEVFTNMRFEPAGMTDDHDIRHSNGRFQPHRHQRGSCDDRNRHRVPGQPERRQHCW